MRHGTPYACPNGQAGFTIIEMVVAMMVLLVGVLGTLTLIETAQSVGTTSRSREAATNLAREIVETSRSIDYDLLLTATAPAELQAIDGLGDEESITSGWQIERRDVMYTVTVEACIYDDPKDGSFTAASASTGYCANSAGSGDANGDDYREITVTAAWGSRQVKLTANVTNPAGGFGPRIASWPPAVSFPSVGLDSILPVTAGTTVSMTVATTAAASLNWDAGDTKHSGQLTSTTGGVSWPVSWNLGTPVPATSYTCATTVDWVPDAPAYQMTVQPFDSSGTPGDLRTQIVAVDRSAPYKLCEFEGGRNPQHLGVVDLQWRASFEGDVVSYRVSRKKQGSEPADPVICAAARTPRCTDMSPPLGLGAIEYEVTPKQSNLGGAISGPAASLTIPTVGVIPNLPPTPPGSVQVVGGTQPTISWTPSSDIDGSVIFYRVYRDGVQISDRYGTTANGFIDKSAGATSHTYWVSAVDNAFAESLLVLAAPTLVPPS